MDSKLATRLSFTVYLDDDYDGGELSFTRADRCGTCIASDVAHVTVKPRRGSAAVFYQCVPEFSHFPHAVRRGHKNIMRTDVMYRFSDSNKADAGGMHVTLSALKLCMNHAATPRAFALASFVLTMISFSNVLIVSQPRLGPEESLMHT
eukprot:gnl/TRDRNA2_/TRDRNA2_40727_c0_seq2.p1 gnl/TRDRNA2_/TRDRNA2_40727_c0~~gnl/TRDRNA2_/TRDRNA2_40727_c0_seq2.p1  ORF type:complete len:149 (+),score=8.77 gnl/TRDRNA2_/TRDRNA2_40727_c0_seq2:460-906(+)